MNFADIKQFPFSRYRVDVSFDHLEHHIAHWNATGQTLLLDPSFQRGLVWTEEQRVSYMEYLLCGGVSGKEIYFNCPQWLSGEHHVYELVDGQQRLNAVRLFMADRLKVFGHLKSDIKGLPLTTLSLSFHVMRIRDRKELLNWYIGMNTGGSVHTKEDLEPAYAEFRKL